MENNNENYQNLTLTIEGMSCGHCSGEVTRILQNIEAIKEIKIDHEMDKGDMVFDKNQMTSTFIISAINKSGSFKASIK